MNINLSLFFRRLHKSLILTIMVYVFSSQIHANFMLSYENVDIKKLSKDVASFAKKTIILDPRVKGNVSIYSEKRLNTQQVWDVYLRTLQVHGFSAIQSNGITKIVPESEATRDQNSDQSLGSLVSQVFELKHHSAKIIKSQIKLLASRKAYVADFEASNALLVVDYKSNILRIKQVLNQLDTDASAKIRSIQLRHLSALEAVRILKTFSNAKNQKLSGFVALPFLADNSVLISSNKLTFEHIKLSLQQLDTRASQDHSSGIIYLKYAKAKDISTVLEKISQNLSVPNGISKPIITFHEATNSLIISSDKATFARFKSVVDKLDIKRAQVLVEAIIVELSDTAAKDIGIQSIVASKDGAPLAYTRFSNKNDIDAAAVTASVLSNNENAALDTAAMSSLLNAKGLIFGAGTIDLNDKSFISILNAIASDQNSNLLSTPSIIALDNEPASLIIGQEIPITTGESLGANNSTPFRTTSREEVGIKLSITPQINEGNAVILKISQEVSSIADEVEGSDFITNKSTIETSVLVNNNQTIVLGGLINQDKQELISRVPILGSIPLLGRFFRSTSKKEIKRSLMVFLKPKILVTDSDLNQLTSSKYNYFKASKFLENLNNTTTTR